MKFTRIIFNCDFAETLNERKNKWGKRNESEKGKKEINGCKKST